MSSKTYDIAIIGGSLTARIAAALLAKQGSRVLLLRCREATATAWFPSSFFLEKLLGILGGRSCFVAQQPIQVLSQYARVTLSNDVPLDKELEREFGATATAATRWLAELHAQGVALEELFWQNRGLCWPSIKSRTSHRLHSLRQRLNWTTLESPVSLEIAQHPQPVRLFLTDLFQGLSLKPTNELSRSSAALLWVQALRPENLQEPDFSQLLNKRFDQFHGAKAHLDELETLDFDGRQWTGGRFKTGAHFKAQTFLLGNVRWIERFQAGKTQPLPQPQQVATSHTSDLTGQLSPLLETRIICGGPLPLRLAIDKQDQQQTGRLLGTPGMSEAQLRQQLEPALPFARYSILTDDDSSSGQPPLEGHTRPRKLNDLPLQIGKNLYCADGTALLPELGAAGAALLGWTLAEHLGDGRQKSKE